MLEKMLEEQLAFEEPETWEAAHSMPSLVDRPQILGSHAFIQSSYCPKTGEINYVQNGELVCFFPVGSAAEALALKNLFALNVSAEISKEFSCKHIGTIFTTLPSKPFIEKARHCWRPASYANFLLTFDKSFIDVDEGKLQTVLHDAIQNVFLAAKLGQLINTFDMSAVCTGRVIDFSDCLISVLGELFSAARDNLPLFCGHYETDTFTSSDHNNAVLASLHRPGSKLQETLFGMLAGTGQFDDPAHITDLTPWQNGMAWYTSIQTDLVTKRAVQNHFVRQALGCLNH